MCLVRNWHDPFHLAIKTADRINLQIILKPNLQKTLPITFTCTKKSMQLLANVIMK